MRDLLATLARRALWLLALAYLWLAAPLDLAVSLTGLVSGPAVIGPHGALLIAARIAVVAVGLVLGRRLAQGTAGTRPFALAWAAGDLGTLAAVLATRVLPSSRAPGDAPIVWAGSLVAALVVVGASAWTAPRQRPTV
jgi:hypothetical protein